MYIFTVKSYTCQHEITLIITHLCSLHPFHTVTKLSSEPQFGNTFHPSYIVNPFMVNLLLLLQAIEVVCCKTFNTEFSLGNYSGLVKVHLGKYVFYYQLSF